MKCNLRWRRKEDAQKKSEGVAAVEFAILLSVFLMMLLGVVEFGYDWYMKHLLTNASRDGCRYGVMYRTVGGNRIAPADLSANGLQTIKDVIDNQLTGLLPAGSWSVPTPTGAGYTDATAGNDLIVTVTGTKTWSALGGLLPSLEGGMTITAQTTMKCE